MGAGLAGAIEGRLKGDGGDDVRLRDFSVVSVVDALSFSRRSAVCEGLGLDGGREVLGEGAWLSFGAGGV